MDEITPNTEGSPIGDAVPADADVTNTSPPNGDGTVTSPGPTDTNWEDDRNPYRYAHQQLSAEMERRDQAWTEWQAGQRIQDLQAKGMSPEQAQASVQNELAAQQLTKMRDQLNQQARPAVAHMLAEKISAQYGVTLKPQELLTTSSGAPVQSVDAMLARADAIISERRKTVADKRSKDGNDKLDGRGPSTTAIDPARYRKMSPAQIIAEGIRQNK